MPPINKKRRLGQLSDKKLQAFTEDSSDESEPDPIALAAELKERGQEHAVGGRFGDARSLLGQAVRLTPGNAELHELHAQVLLELGCTWEAVRAATRAVELTPHWAEAHVTLARAQMNLGEPALAEASYGRALEHKLEDEDVVAAELREARSLAEKQRALGAGVRAVVRQAHEHEGEGA